MPNTNDSFRFNQDYHHPPKYEHRHAGPATDDETDDAPHECTCGFVAPKDTILDHVTRAARDVERWRNRSGFYATTDAPTKLNSREPLTED